MNMEKEFEGPRPPTIPAFVNRIMLLFFILTLGFNEHGCKTNSQSRIMVTKYDNKVNFDSYYFEFLVVPLMELV